MEDNRNLFSWNTQLNVNFFFFSRLACKIWEKFSLWHVAYHYLQFHPWFLGFYNLYSVSVGEERGRLGTGDWSIELILLPTFHCSWKQVLFWTPAPQFPKHYSLKFYLPPLSCTLNLVYNTAICQLTLHIPQYDSNDCNKEMQKSGNVQKRKLFS